MQHTMRFGPDDRDDQGFIRVRTLADLLPETPAEPAAETAEPPAEQSTPPRARWALPGSRQQQLSALGIAGGLVLALGLIYAIGALAPAAAPPRPAPSPTAAPATPAPSSLPPTTAPPIAAYWGPGGDRAPDIAAGTVFTPTARYGDTWVSVALPGGGNVWIGRGDAISRGPLPDALPDLAAPTPAPPRPVSPPAPAAATEIPADAPAAPAGCSLPDRPSHTSTRQVLRGQVPIGQVTGVGCSQAEADANAEQLAAAMLGGH